MNELTLKEPDLTLYQSHVPAIVSVFDAETEAMAAEHLAAVRHEIRRIEAGQKEWTSPLEAFKKKIIASFARKLAPLRDFNEAQTAWITQYRQRLENLRLNEEIRLKELAQKRFDRAVRIGKPPPLPVPIAPAVMPLEKTVGGVTYTERWTAEVADVTQIPLYFQGAQLMQPDMVAARKLVNAGIREIPGFRIFKERGARVR